MKKISVLETNHTWSIVPILPEGKTLISCKWIYKVFKADGSIDRYKSRLVKKIEKKQWTLLQLDINNAFLNGKLREEVYMKVVQLKIRVLYANFTSHYMASRKPSDNDMLSLIYYVV